MGSIAAGAWAQADKGETSVDKTVDLNPVVVTGTGTPSATEKYSGTGIRHHRQRNKTCRNHGFPTGHDHDGSFSLILPECHGFVSDDERTFQ